MKRYAWLGMIALTAACGGDDDSSGNTADAGTLDASTLDAATATSDGGLQTEAAKACTSQPTQQAKVACAANAVLATLTDTQKTSVNMELTDYVSRSKWSNLPAGGMNVRAGVQMSALGTASKAATLDLMTVSLNTLGQTTATGILRADDYLAANGGGSGYGSSLYSIAIFGTPGPSSNFEVMFGGHHMAYNLSFVDGSLYPAPQHLGVEPKGAFTQDGASYDPMSSKGDAIFAIYDALDATQKTTSYLSGEVYSDTLVAPSLDYAKGSARTTSTAYPTGTKRKGVKVSDLSADQQRLVTAAIEQWVRQYPSEVVDALMSAYTGAYSDTLFAWAGSASGPNKDVNGSYLRIDGPRVWIELACQSGVVIRDKTHYHTIYRDKEKDYGGQF